MNSRQFRIGDEVEIIGPSRIGTVTYTGNIGKKIRITDIILRHGEIFFSGENVGWFPDSSLQLLYDLKLGDVVEVIGIPLKDNDFIPEMKKTIGNIYSIKKIHDTGYFGVTFGLDVPNAMGECGLFWYRADNLHKISPKELEIKVGDWVKIIGQPDGYDEIWNVEGKIDQVREIESKGRFWLNKTCLLYRAENLRKLSDREVKEHLALKVGDWVEVVGGPCCGKTVDTIFQIEKINQDISTSGTLISYSARKQADYPASSLRKLTPEEVQAHLQPIKVDPTMKSILDLRDRMEERLSAIEKRLDSMRED